MELGQCWRSAEDDNGSNEQALNAAGDGGGADLAGNPTLYDAVQKAKKTSVPNDNIERARKRGAGEEAGGADWQTIMYEGYGPNGVAINRDAHR